VQGRSYASRTDGCTGFSFHDEATRAEAQTRLAAAGARARRRAEDTRAGAEKRGRSWERERTEHGGELRPSRGAERRRWRLEQGRRACRGREERSELGKRENRARRRAPAEQRTPAPGKWASRGGRGSWAAARFLGGGAVPGLRVAARFLGGGAVPGRRRGRGSCRVEWGFFRSGPDL
jgi:hypothetical protein